MTEAYDYNLIIERTWYRPNETVQWFVTPTDVEEYIKINFKDKGLLLSEIWTESDDKLSTTGVFTFLFDPAIMESWGSDVIIDNWKKERDSYCKENNINYSLYKFYFFDKTTNEKIFITESPT